MTQTLELSDMDFKINVINMSKKIGDNVESITRELESTKKKTQKNPTQMTILEL